MGNNVDVIMSYVYVENGREKNNTEMRRYNIIIYLFDWRSNFGSLELMMRFEDVKIKRDRKEILIGNLKS
jgi:hypothetical protein